MRALLLLASFLSASPVFAGDWPQWLGPNRDALSTEKLDSWTETPKTAWRAAVGEGHSSPVVANGVVYLHTKVERVFAEQVSAYDAKSGERKWFKVYERPAFESRFGNGPRATPVVSDGVLYTYGITGILTAWKADTGDKIWEVDCLKKYNAKNLTFGVSASPLVVGNLVVVQVGGAGHSIVAFDAKTGAEVWKALDDPASYAAPMVHKEQIIVLTGANVAGISLKGEVLWKHPFKDLLNESSTTPVVHDGKVIVASVTAGAVCLELVAKDGKIEPKEVWKKPELSCYFSTPVPSGKEHLYMVTGQAIPPKPARLRCVEAATGKTVWEKEKIGKYHASIIRLGDGKMLLMDDNGELAMLEGGSKEYKELARSKLFPANGDAWAHPALAEGRFFMRSGKDLIQFEMK